jgi:hypothetical protein
VQGRWLHARHVEWKWRLVGSVGREVAGGRVAVAHTGPASGHRLDLLHTGGCCMCGAWKSGGRWQRSAVMALGGGDHNRAMSEHAPGAVGLSGQYCSTGPGPIRCTIFFLIIQTLLRYQNTK